MLIFRFAVGVFHEGPRNDTPRRVPSHGNVVDEVGIALDAGGTAAGIGEYQAAVWRIIIADDAQELVARQGGATVRL